MACGVSSRYGPFAPSHEHSGRRTFIWSRQVGTAMRLTLSEEVLMSTLQSRSTRRGRETVKETARLRAHAPRLPKPLLCDSQPRGLCHAPEPQSKSLREAEAGGSRPHRKSQAFFATALCCLCLAPIHGGCPSRLLPAHTTLQMSAQNERQHKAGKMRLGLSLRKCVASTTVERALV